ncbi:MAG: class I SAM-dependent methyltransferase [bacterium]|nr:class I SAM-dependent methyltransferase [bacterium]
MEDSKWNKIIKENQQEFTPVISDHRTKMMLKHIQGLIPKCAKNILEIGIGDGWFMNELRKAYPDAKITGLTLGQAEVDFARDKFGLGTESTPLFVGDMHDMPFDDNTFDCIVHRDVLEHSVAPYPLLKELNRVMDIGGTMVFGIPSYEWRNFDAHYSVMCPDQLCILAHKAGWNVKQIQTPVWMFWGMTFGYRSWVYTMMKEEEDDWYWETEEMFNKATKQSAKEVAELPE